MNSDARSPLPATRYSLPALGQNPSSARQGTTPGSFANPPQIGGPRTFSSPDTPGMPAPSDKTAWDFVPEDWRPLPEGRRLARSAHPELAPANAYAFEAPPGFEPITQLEFARLGQITPEMRRVAEREPHLSAEEIRDEIAAGRLMIPANRIHLANKLDPMAIGRASAARRSMRTWAPPPISSSTHEEVEKLQLGRSAGKRRHRDGPFNGRRRRRRPVRPSSPGGDGAHRDGPDLLHDPRPQDRGPQPRHASSRPSSARPEQGVDYMTIHAGVRKRPHAPGREAADRHRLPGRELPPREVDASTTTPGKPDVWPRSGTISAELVRRARRLLLDRRRAPPWRPRRCHRHAAQLAELQAIGELTERAWRHGCPGHGRRPRPCPLRSDRVQRQTPAPASVTARPSMSSAPS
jgi:phosphomethylpyrimidine synthase